VFKGKWDEGAIYVVRTPRYRGKLFFNNWIAEHGGGSEGHRERALEKLVPR